ncbi:GGDEF domain-containing protein [uncultured Cetobacterium sp.]|uniref:GGDEF domain-containing protein n=1 Tax=uncultured Cetobacterium sp. TaxID=527638 RepID=UPI00262A62E1|nr:GGDEF domain-containing protein [uncultured Cetobacterium sp.]
MIYNRKKQYIINIILLFLIFGIFIYLIKNNLFNKNRYFINDPLFKTSSKFNTKDLSKIEVKLLDDFKKIAPPKYPELYMSIVEKNRVLFDKTTDYKVPNFILKELLQSEYLDSREKLYILNKLRILNSSSINILNSIKYTIEYLKLATLLKSQYDIDRAKIALASILSGLNGKESAIKLLLEVKKEKNMYEFKNRVTILVYLHLIENYLDIKDYKNVKIYLNNLDVLFKNEKSQYKFNILIFKNLLNADLQLDLNNKKKALIYLNNAKYYLNKLNKIYFVGIRDHYILSLENYNLKYNFKKFSEKKIFKYIEEDSNFDYFFSKKAYDMLFKYYYKNNNLKKYKSLKERNDMVTTKLNDSNNKIITLFLIESIEKDFIDKENRVLYKNLIMLSIIILLIIGLSLFVNSKLKIESEIDGLTKLKNRKSFDKKIKRLKNKKYYMFLFDIDNFKKINDNYGHLIGDEVLERIGQILNTRNSNNITTYRVGGEEFIVIFENINFVNSKEESENIRKSIEKNKWNRIEKVTISGGFSNSNENTYKTCDKLLYFSKNTGKNKITYF